MSKLSERAVASAKPRGKVYRLSDGGGLLLQVQPKGGRAWLYRFQLAGRRRDMGIGPYPEIGLAAARIMAQDAARLVAQGGDPITAQRGSRQASADATAEAALRGARTFRDVGEALVRTQSAGWSSGKTLASWRLTLDKHAYPALGHLPIADVGRADVVAALSEIWSTRPATGKKLQRRIASILDYATALGWRDAANPATGRTLRITKALAAQPPSRRQAALPWDRTPAFLRALDDMPGIAPACLRFGILTCVRSAEVRLGTWSEIDLTTRVWTIPSSRMKGGRAHAMAAHRVPLSDAAIQVLERLATMRAGKPVAGTALLAHARMRGDALLFPSVRDQVVLSDAALGAVIRRMNEGRDPMPWRDVDRRQITAHGFRRSFRSWIDDTRPTEGEAAEKALAHEDSNAVRRAYRGSDMLEQRRPLMNAWGRFCAGKQD